MILNIIYFFFEISNNLIVWRIKYILFLLFDKIIFCYFLQFILCFVFVHLYVKYIDVTRFFLKIIQSNWIQKVLFIIVLERSIVVFLNFIPYSWKPFSPTSYFPPSRIVDIPTPYGCSKCQPILVQTNHPRFPK